MKAKKWTISEIAAVLQENGSHYFDRDTLRFFGQRRSDFRVYQGGGRVFMFSAAHKGWDGPSLSSFAEFLPETGRTASIENPTGENWTREDVKQFVADIRKGGKS